MFERKVENSQPLLAPTNSSNVYHHSIGPAAYAPLTEAPEKKAEKEIKEQDFKLLYGEEKRITSFPKSPEMVSIKLPHGIQTHEDLKAKISALKSSPHLSKDELTKLEALNKQVEMNKAFQAQFDKLIGMITAWALNTKGDVDRLKAAENFEFFRNNLFTDSFAGDQSSLYFEELKDILEQFYLYFLSNDSIPDHVKAKKLNALLPHLIVCGPGTHAHLQEDMDLGLGTFSLASSLAGMRTLIVDKLASRYVLSTRLSHRLSPGSERHVKTSYLKLAKQLGLNPVWKEPKDQFHIHTGLDGKKTNSFFTDPNNANRRQFEYDFRKEFYYAEITNEILEHLLSALYDAIKSAVVISDKAAQNENQKRQADFKNGVRYKLELLQEVKMKGDYWPTHSKDVMEVVKATLKLAGIEFDEDFLEYQETHAKFKRKELREKLMQGLMDKGIFEKGLIFQGKIYFYKDYIPEGNAMNFALLVQEGMAQEFKRLEMAAIPESVHQQMYLRLIAKQVEGANLLAHHIKLKLAIAEENTQQITALLNTPGIDLNYKLHGKRKLDPKETVWEYAVRNNKIKALEILLNSKTISQQELDRAFQQSFMEFRFDLCDVFLKKEVVSDTIKKQIADAAIREKNKRKCQYLLDRKIITTDQYDVSMKAEEKAPGSVSHAFFKKPSTRSLPKDAEGYFQDLLQHIAMGNPAGVEEILKNRSPLVLYPGQVTDEAGKTMQGTPYQIALAVEDTQMAALLKKCIIDVMGDKEGVKEADAQYRAQFPEGWEKQEEQSWAPIFAQLDTLTQAIRRADPTDIISQDRPNDSKLSLRECSEVALVLAEFQALLAAKLKEVLIIGRHFNPRLLQRAFDIYDKHFIDYFGNDEKDPRARLFWQQVIGSIERMMPANYVQALCSGFYDTASKLRKGQQQSRTFKVQALSSNGRMSTIDVYPLAKSLLGTDLAIYSGKATETCAGVSRHGLDRIFEDYYVKQKTDDMQSLGRSKSLVVARNIFI